MLGSSSFNSKYTIVEKIGQGSFGAVYKCIHKKSGIVAAAKKIEMTGDTIFFKRLLREVLLLKYLNYEHIIQLLDCFLGYDKRGPHIYFVTELMQINLRDLIVSNDEPFTHDHVKFYLYQIFLALTYLHLNNIVHRDIKPDNILVNTNNDIRVVDFGWARHINSTYELTKVIANIHYRAPEVCLRNQIHDSKVDIWAVGCLFYEMLTKNFLFIDKQDTDLLTSMFKKFGTLTPDEMNFIENSNARAWVEKHGFIEKKRPSDYLQNFNDPLGKDLFDQCMQINPHQRIGALEALQHPYFKDIFDPKEMQKGMLNHSNVIDFSFEADPNLTKEQLFMRINKEIEEIPHLE